MVMLGMRPVSFGLQAFAVRCFRRELVKVHLQVSHPDVGNVDDVLPTTKNHQRCSAWQPHALGVGWP